jgi:hypothetical protein
MHAAPAITGVKVGVPLTHASVVQSLPSLGRSALSPREVTSPEPSQIASRQSPEVCVDVSVPAAASSTPHLPPTHVRCSQSSS